MKVAPQVVSTTVVGSYPQPPWLIDRAFLAKGVPRVRADELWALPPDLLAGAQDDAAELAIRDMERAGIDVITDGEVRRESYSNHLIAALEGIDAVHPAALTNRAAQHPRAEDRRPDTPHQGGRGRCALVSAPHD